MKISGITSNNFVNFGTKLPKQTQTLYERDSVMREFKAKDYWPDFIEACVKYNCADRLEESLEKMSTNNINNVLGLECVRTQKAKFIYSSVAGGCICEAPHKMDIFLTLSDSTDALEKAREAGKYSGTPAFCTRVTNSMLMYPSAPPCSKNMCKKILESLENFISANTSHTRSKTSAILNKFREI
jgi:hypothetical protein